MFAHRFLAILLAATIALATGAPFAQASSRNDGDQRSHSGTRNHRWHDRDNERRHRSHGRRHNKRNRDDDHRHGRRSHRRHQSSHNHNH
jgi:hypothetical protein